VFEIQRSLLVLVVAEIQRDLLVLVVAVSSE